MGTVWTSDGKTLDTPRIRDAKPVFVPYRAEQIAPLLDATRRPIERCLAMGALPVWVSRLFFRPSTVDNMRTVARKLCPVLLERARSTPGISLRMLVHVAFGRTPEEQINRWNDYLLRGKED